MRLRIQWWIVKGRVAPHNNINYEWMILHRGGHTLVLVFLFGFVSEVLSLPKESRYPKRQLHPEFTSPPPPFIVA